MDRLNKVIAQVGDQPVLRVDKAEILVKQAKDQDKEALKRDLAGLSAGIDQWTIPQKIEFWGGMARIYLNLNMIDEARQYLISFSRESTERIAASLGIILACLGSRRRRGHERRAGKDPANREG